MQLITSRLHVNWRWIHFEALWKTTMSKTHEENVLFY